MIWALRHGVISVLGLCAFASGCGDEEPIALIPERYIEPSPPGPFHDRSASFDAPKPINLQLGPLPIVERIQPEIGLPGGSIVIRGSSFGTRASSSTVNVGSGAASEIRAWSDTQIEVVVPRDTSAGKKDVVVK